MKGIARPDISVDLCHGKKEAYTPLLLLDIQLLFLYIHPNPRRIFIIIWNPFERSGA